MVRKIFIAVIAISLMVTAAYAYEDGDFQIWHTEVQELKLHKDYKAELEEEFRWGDGASEFYYQHYQVGLSYSANKNIDLGVYYRQIYELKKGKFRAENRPHFNLTLKTDLYGFKIEDRNRIEYRHFSYQDDFCAYRNKLTLKYPVNVDKMKLEPYAANEIFVDLKDKGGFVKNRLYAGLGLGITKNVKVDFYYMLQTSKSSSSWTNANVFGTKVKIAF